MTAPDPFADLAAAMAGTLDIPETAGVRVDTSRRQRTGVPEVIYGKGKTPEQVVVAVRRLVLPEGRVLAARITPAQAEYVIAELSQIEIAATYDPVSQTLIAKSTLIEPERTGGRVGIITAGSSDRGHGAEAAAVLHEMGCDTKSAHDAGVAGLHRLVQPLRTMLEFDPDCLIVAAGMDGVLPGVISGLVAIPIVGLPTSTGYGFGGEGIGALTTMLQACSPGVAVVNIDNGVGAGVTAGLIANRAATRRTQ